jgi:hypothetical protein
MRDPRSSRASGNDAALRAADDFISPFPPFFLIAEEVLRMQMKPCAVALARARY